MAISKSNFIAKFKYHWVGFNIHKEFLQKSLEKANEELSDTDIDSLTISLTNMREQIEIVENYMAEQ